MMASLYHRGSWGRLLLPGLAGREGERFTGCEAPRHGGSRRDRVSSPYWAVTAPVNAVDARRTAALRNAAGGGWRSSKAEPRTADRSTPGGLGILLAGAGLGRARGFDPLHGATQELEAGWVELVAPGTQPLGAAEPRLETQGGGLA
jgi:hypothetical protein